MMSACRLEGFALLLRSSVVPLTALVVAATGCTAIRQSSAVDHERTLAAAGFQMKLADTGERATQVAGLPQRKLTRVPYQGEIRWVYADSQFCKCAYVGTEAAYDRYQRLVVGQRIAEEEQEAEMNWGGWGAWGPWY
jgi:hypothetical protein